MIPHDSLFPFCEDKVSVSLLVHFSILLSKEDLVGAGGGGEEGSGKSPWVTNTSVAIINSDPLSPSQNRDTNFVSMDYPHPNQKAMVQGDGVARGQFLCDPYTCTVCLTLSYNG